MPCAFGSVGSGHADGGNGNGTAGSSPRQEPACELLPPGHSQQQHPGEASAHTVGYPSQQGGMPQAGDGGGGATAGGGGPGGDSQQQAQEAQPEQTEEEKAAAAAAAAEERRREDAVLAQARKIREVLNAAKVGAAPASQVGASLRLARR